jgi:DNA-binding CsgD family transcriptional regulator
MKDARACVSQVDDVAVASRVRAAVRVRRSLTRAGTLSQLLSTAADAVRVECSFDRAVILTVRDGMLSADESDALDHGPSDELRRAVAGRPVPLKPGTEEHDVIRRAGGPHRGRPSEPSHLIERLELAECALVAIASDGVALGLVVAERRRVPVSEADVASLELVADLIALQIALLSQRERVRLLAGEVRHFAANAGFLIREVMNGPPAIPRDAGFGLSFPDPHPAAMPSGATLDVPLSERERAVVDHLARGRSNREIAEALMLSPETVKKHVGRLMRKLGASNRAEVVSRYLQLTRGT